jgi:hypothetical protein
MGSVIPIESGHEKLKKDLKPQRAPRFALCDLWLFYKLPHNDKGDPNEKERFIQDTFPN